MGKSTTNSTGLPPLEDEIENELTETTSNVNIDSLTHTVGTASPNPTEVVAEEKDLHPNLPRIEIKYPKNFEGKKFFTDGDIVPVSPELALQLIELGIAKEV